MAKVVELKKGQKDLKKAVESYYKIATPEDINRIKLDILNPSKNFSQRRKSYTKHKRTLLLLKPLFRKIKKAHIQIAKDQDSRSYLDFRLRSDGVSKKKFDFFLTNADTVINNINKNLPIPKDTLSWYWSEFNIPDPLDWVDSKKYLIPNDVYKMVKEMVPNFEKITKRIKVVEKLDFYPVTRYKKDTKSVTIEFSAGERRIYGVLDFVHELGHAMAVLKCVDKGIDPYSKSKYWHEKQAYDFKFEFEEKVLPKDVKNASRGEALSVFSSTFFESNVYASPNQDFDKAYAKAINRCYPGKSSQKSNPFYVLENGFIFRPFGSLASSVVQTELHLDG